MVRQLLHLNQFVIDTKSATYFQSYESVVAKVTTSGQLYVSLNWNYSNTTRKHLYEFIRQYAPNKYEQYTTAKAMRKAIENGIVKLVHTKSMAMK